MEEMQLSVPFLIVAMVLSLLIIIGIGAPIMASLGFVGILFLFITHNEHTLGIIANIAYVKTSSEVLATVPLFILMGEFLLLSGIGSKLFDMANKWIGHVHGGLAIASIGACGVFASMVGVTQAGVAAIGIVAIPEMLKRGYNKMLAVGTIAAGAALAILIPPSVIMIVYCVSADQSVGKLFTAGFIPGGMLMIIYSAYIYIQARFFKGGPQSTPFTWKERFASLTAMLPAIVLILAVLGTIYGGIAVPSEAAAIGALVSFLLGAFFYRTLNIKNTWEAIKNSTLIAGRVLMILVGATFLSYTMTILRIPFFLSEFAVGLSASPYIVLALLFFVLIVLGFFLDGLAIVLITTPLFLPIITSLGFDPIWYGVVLVISVEIAVITPPVGMNLFMVSAIIPDVSFVEATIGCIPFVFLDILAVVILTIFPQIALWLPSTM